MKESIFNIHTETEGHKLLFNSLYCGLCEIDDSYYRVLDKINNGQELSVDEQELLKTAIDAGFLVQDDMDELEFLRVNKYRAKFSENQLTITIAPTLACNFQCIYCYEDNKFGSMTEDTENKIIEYIERRAEKIKNLKITWYGGEPLLAREIIYRMSEKICKICNEHKIEYSASMITNGSLITEMDVQLFEKYRIRSIQITLDGSAEIHNKRRICNSIENNFEVVVNNMNLLFGKNVALHLRVNVDKNNINQMENLFAELGDRLVSKDVNVGFAPVQACTDACVGVADDCFNVQEFSVKYFELYEIVEKYGFDIGTKLKYAFPRINYCGADVYSSFVVDSKGFLYKCWHDVGDAKRSIGSVDNIDAALVSSATAKWLFSDAVLNEECRSCKVLPLCMGGCPSMNFYNSCRKTCQEAKYNISEILIRNYYKHI